MTTVVSRILLKHVACFRGQKVDWHLEHKYSTQSAIRSELVRTLNECE